MITVATAGVWIGALDMLWHGKIQRHVVLDSTQRTDYPDVVDGRKVGGFWAYAACGDPTYWCKDSTDAARALPECPGCWTADGTSEPRP